MKYDLFENWAEKLGLGSPFTVTALKNKASRQYRHNVDNSPDLFNPEQGFVAAYDKDVIDQGLEILGLQIEKLEAEKAAHRWNFEVYDENRIGLCRNRHDKNAPCEYERYVKWTAYEEAVKTVLRVQAKARILQLRLDAINKALPEYMETAEIEKFLKVVTKHYQQLYLEPEGGAE